MMLSYAEFLEYRQMWVWPQVLLGGFPLLPHAAWDRYMHEIGTMREIGVLTCKPCTFGVQTCVVFQHFGTITIIQEWPEHGWLADLHGPKWTSSGQNGSILVHFGLANAKNPVWNKAILTKMVVWTILVQHTFRQYRGHSLIMRGF